ncbi:amidohydrolase family protein [Alicyclobacillus mengziensis]|uniref:Amidohydrolase family protein n=1 Tax=Alicyclobacillus mengziensis TaxID=2931921 RepID=A0A9X7W2N1_9BACL|nr:amidohydrolase family protein [Alicyclobacillus mengziensis]QSO49387.1 amidohydrolase family protein [Alicyclobacillus mengziensis]
MSDKVLIRNGCVLTMDDTLGNYETADILIEDGKIVAVQPNLDVTEAKVVDATGMIVLPGFVDTHRHVWEAVIRNAGADWSLQTYLGHLYFGGLGGKLRPEDVYIGNLLGALEALDAGITTMLDWSMVNSPEHGDEMVRALQESGIRGVFAHGTPLLGAGDYWSRDSILTHSHDAKRMKEKYFSSKDQLLTMGLAIRGPEFSSWEATLHDVNLARELDAICTMHVGFGSWGFVDHSIEKMYKAGLLGPDMNLVHANSITDEACRMIAETGTSVSVTPEVEMMMGHGYPLTGRLLEQGGRPTIGIDVVTSTGGDMFAQMKFAVQADRQRVNAPVLARGEMPLTLNVSAAEVLKFATMDGARALGLEAKVGSLTPGKQADIVMIRATDINLTPMNDPIGAVVLCAHTGNVDTVFVAGRAVKRGGRLLDVDMGRISALAAKTRDYIFSEYGVPEGAWPQQYRTVTAAQGR